MKFFIDAKGAFHTCQTKRTSRVRPRIKADRAFVSRFDMNGELITKGKRQESEVRKFDYTIFGDKRP